MNPIIQTLIKERFNCLCKDTNAQEGYGHLLKQWAGKNETFESLPMIPLTIRPQRASSNQNYGQIRKDMM